MNDGAISKNLLETAGLNVGNIIIGKLFGDKTVPIHCAAADMPAKNGVFDMRLFVFDTADAVINVDGTVNLATERFDLDVKPHTRNVRIFSLRSPLYVKGTLANPDVGVQKGPLLMRGAGAVALSVVAAPAAALLALIAPSHDHPAGDCRSAPCARCSCCRVKSIAHKVRSYKGHDPAAASRATSGARMPASSGANSPCNTSTRPVCRFTSACCCGASPRSSAS
ncbi:MAG: hypothetical protein ACYCZD_07675 [Rhodanobacter sp.]